MVKRKRKSPRETIEAEKKPWLEQMYLKFPGNELTDVARDRKRGAVSFSMEKTMGALSKYGKGAYSNLHTHPHKYGIKDQALPSADDLGAFLNQSQEKTMAIVSQNKRSGKVSGSFLIRKKNHTYGSNFDESRVSGLLDGYKKSSADEKRSALEGLSDKYRLQFRQLDAEGKTIHQYNSSKVPRFSAVGLMIAVASGAFFLSPTLTGNAIGNLTTTTSNIIGAGLFVVGIVGSYSYFRKKFI
jgi:hypothetical protein